MTTSTQPLSYPESTVLLASATTGRLLLPLPLLHTSIVYRESDEMFCGCVWQWAWLTAGYITRVGRDLILLIYLL